MSALTNVLLTVMVARTSTPQRFGEFSLVYVVFVLVLGLTRTTGGGVLAIEYADDPPSLHKAAAHSTGYAFGVGASVGAVGLLLGAVVGSAGGTTLVVVSLGLPLLMVQDAWRSLFFAQGRSRVAFVNDSVWLSAQVGLLLVLFAVDPSPGAVALVACWVCAGGLAALVGGLQSRIVPRPAPPLRWVRAHGRVAWPLVASELLTQLPAQLVYLLLPLVAGAADLGVLRAAYVFFGPLAVLNAGAAMLVLPMAVELRRQGRVPVLGRQVSAVLASVACGWGLVVVAAPDVIGRALVGDSWEDSVTTRALLALSLVAEAVLVGQCVALAALRDTRRLARLRAVSAPLTVGLGVALASAYGAGGAAAGFAVGYWVAAVLAWSAVGRHRGLRRRAVLRLHAAAGRS